MLACTNAASTMLSVSSGIDPSRYKNLRSSPLIYYVVSDLEIVLGVHCDVLYGMCVGSFQWLQFPQLLCSVLSDRQTSCQIC